MVRSNQSFLNYLAKLYEAQPHKADIIVKSYSTGQRLFTQHESASKVMLIKEGITKCFFTEENDKDYIVEFLGKGEILGEIEFIQKIPCLCSVEAVTDVTVYAIAPAYFRTLLEKEIALNNILLEVFAERIVNTSSRASYQQLYTTDYTVAKLLALQEKQGITIARADKAAYLGITIRSLNRALKSLVKS